MEIGKRIKITRQQKGISAETLAEMVGVSPSTMYRYENEDISNMGVDKLQNIASALNVTASYLLGWDDSTVDNISLHFQCPDLFKIVNELDAVGFRKVLSYAIDIRDTGKYLRKDPDVDAALEKIRENMGNGMVSKKEEVK